jgi:hypothetical protein
MNVRHHNDTETQQAKKKNEGITARTSEDSKYNTPIFRFNRRGTMSQNILVQDLKYSTLVSFLIRLILNNFYIKFLSMY